MVGEPDTKCMFVLEWIATQSQCMLLSVLIEGYPTRIKHERHSLTLR